MGVKVADGQALHVGEELDAQVAQGTLGDVDHDAGVEPGSEDAHHIDAADAHQCTGQRCKAGVLLLGHGDDIVVDKGLQEQACLHIGQRTDHDADEHEDAVRQIVLEHLCHDALEQLARVLDLRTRASHAAGAGAMDDFLLSVLPLLLTSLLVEVAAALSLAVVDFLIDRVVLQQFLVGAEAVDLAVVQHEDAVGILHRGNALCNDDLGGAGDLLTGTPSGSLRRWRYPRHWWSRRG